VTRGPALDLGRLLGLTGPGAWALAGLYIAVYLVLGLTAGLTVSRTPTGATALALLLSAAIVIVLPGRHPIPLPLAAGVIAVAAVANAAVMWQLSPYGWPGWPAWTIGASTFLMFMIALRGRIVVGALGMLVMTAVIVHWTWSTTGDVLHGLELTYWQLASYAAGAFYAGILRRTGRQIVAFQEAERRSAAAEEARAAADEERATQLSRVRRLAAAALEEIAAGEQDAERRRAHGLLEAELRDQIRGRALAAGPVPAAARAARSRGVAVDLLDDLRDGPLPDLADARAWVAGRLDATADGDATVRVTSTDQGVSVTFAAAGRDVEVHAVSTAEVSG
jgi:hypothetical protein